MTVGASPSAEWWDRRAGHEPAFAVTVRDRTGREVESVGAYLALAFTLRLRDVGDWSLELPAGHHAIPLLLLDGAGIVVRRGGVVVLSGEVAGSTTVVGDDDPAADGTIVSGATDDDVLSGDVVYPDPAVPVPLGELGTVTPARDIYTGPAEDALVHYVGRNIGQGAPQVLRRRIVVPPSAGRGGVRTYSERWSTLLDTAQRIGAASSLAWRVAQHPTEAYQRLEVWSQARRPDALFSRSSGTAGRIELERATPDVTDVIVAGGGVGTSRLLTRVTAPGTVSVPFFPLLPVTLYDGQQTRTHRARTRFLDADSEVLPDLVAAGRDELAQVASPLVVRMTVVEQPWLRWPEHYGIGDVVTVSTGPASSGGVRVEDVVTALAVTDDASGVTVTPTVGADGSASTSEPVARAVQRQVARIRRE